MTNFVSETFNNVGDIPAQPTSGSIRATVVRNGAFFRVDITLDAFALAVTDAGASGSYGATALFNFVEGAFVLTGCRQNYSNLTATSAVTTSNGDAAFKIGVGTVIKAAAADGALAGTNDDDVGGEISGTQASNALSSPITLTAGISVAIDGTAAAKSLYLNWSGTAATVDASGTIYITGTVSFSGVSLSDD